MLALVRINSTGTEAAEGSGARFVTTHWSVVLVAGRTDSTRAQNALARLCQTYWYPLYAYVRRRGHSPHDAQDLTQEFFARLLERHTLAIADPSRGRFRSFLLSTMSHFLAHEWEKLNAQKRGGGLRILSLDLARAEERYDLEPTDNSTPDKLFDKHWATALLEEVLNQLEAEYQHTGKAELFASLKQTLTGTGESQPYAFLAARLGMNEAAIKVAVKGTVQHTVAEGDGPVNALDAALRKALVKFFPRLAEVKLEDYKVRVLDGTAGTAAKVRVLIESTDGQARWGTIGVSTNIIEASWLALIDSLMYKLMIDRSGRA